MKEKRREPEVPEERVPVAECLDGHARITSKELAQIHSVKSGTLQNACSTRPRVVVGLGKSAHSHIVRLKNNLVKRSRKNDDRSAVAMLKKYQLHDRTVQPVVGRDTRHESNHGPVGCSSSNARQFGCVFQDMEPPKLSSILRKSSDMQKPIPRVKVTKAIARRTKIRFAQLNVICVAPTLQNLRIGLRRREWQEQGAREAAWKLAKSVSTIKGEKQSNIFLTL